MNAESISNARHCKNAVNSQPEKAPFYINQTNMRIFYRQVLNGYVLRAFAIKRAMALKESAQ
jgi:hypothetical protein